MITLCLTLLLFLCSTAVTLCVTSNEIVADPRENSIAEDGSLVQKENFWTDAKAQGMIMKSEKTHLKASNCGARTILKAILIMLPKSNCRVFVKSCPSNGSINEKADLMKLVLSTNSKKGLHQQFHIHL